MNTLRFDPCPMDQLEPSPRGQVAGWLWYGYLARGNVTLLTSQWKAGKTTLLAGLLRSFAGGGVFLDLPCAAANAVVVSEESAAHWVARQQAIPIGSHTRLVSRPFPGRPTADQWDELVVHAECLRAEGALDVFVVDPLASFLPGRSESDPGTLMNMLHPLRRLAEAGVAVLVLHHPRKKPADEGSTARGSGAPSAGQLYEWLSRAVREKLVDRLGAGTKAEPYRFRLPRKDNNWLGVLPPLEPLRWPR